MSRAANRKSIVMLSVYGLGNKRARAMCAAESGTEGASRFLVGTVGAKANQIHDIIFEEEQNDVFNSRTIPLDREIWSISRSKDPNLFFICSRGLTDGTYV